MSGKHFTLTLETAQSAEKVFEAITRVRDWWTGFFGEELMGETEKLNDTFSFRAGDGAHYSEHQLVEVVPGKKIVWLTTNSDLNFIQQKDEWTGTKVIFEIKREEGKTKLVFTHEGLTPDVECYNACSPAWTQYLQQKLLPLINADK